MFDGRDEQPTVDACAGRELSERLARLSATARSPDESVSVTVGANGAVTALRLAEEVRRRPAQDTARDILATLARAQAALTTAAAQATDETIGAESATGRAVIASYAARQAAPVNDGRPPSETGALPEQSRPETRAAPRPELPQDRS